jgi:hypothetical protein
LGASKSIVSFKEPEFGSPSESTVGSHSSVVGASAQFSKYQAETSSAVLKSLIT